MLISLPMRWWRLAATAQRLGLQSPAGVSGLSTAWRGLVTDGDEHVATKAKTIKGALQAWQGFLQLLSQEQGPSTSEESIRLGHRSAADALLTAFARHRPDLLFVLDTHDVTALAQTSLLPRGYRDKRLLNASSRLGSSFTTHAAAGNGAVVGGPGHASGAASLQDLLRVLRDWAELLPTREGESPSGIPPLVHRIALQLAAASALPPDPDNARRAQLSITPTLEQLAATRIPQRRKPRGELMPEHPRHAAKLLEAAAEGIVEEGDWECSVCSSLNHRHRRACRLCDLPCGTLRNRRVTRQDVEGLYGKELPTRQQAALEQRRRAIAIAEAAGRHEGEGGREAVKVATRPQRREQLDEGREDSSGALHRGDCRAAAGNLSDIRRSSAAPPEATPRAEEAASSARDDAEEDYSVRRLMSVAGSGVLDRAQYRGGRGSTLRGGAAGAAAADGAEELSEGEDEDEDETLLGATDVTRPESRHHYDDFYAGCNPSRGVTSRGGSPSRSAPSRVGGSAVLKPKRQQKSGIALGRTGYQRS